MAAGDAMPVGEDDLQAWVDGRLPPERRTAVDAWLAANPVAAARFRAMAAQREMLRDALRPHHDAPMPARLRVANLLAARREAQGRGQRRIAAAAAWLVLGGVLGWAGNALLPQRERPMVTEALAAHAVFAADAGRPVEISVAQEAQMLRWLSDRLGRPLVVPELGPAGYRLMGGRLLAGATGDPAAQLMYEGPRGARLTLYLRADRAGGAGAEFRYAEGTANSVTAFWWVDRGFGYAVAAEGLNRAALLHLAEAVHRQVAGAPHPDPGL
ncbi:anti-sigma factor family protein [Plastoroseomonas hellenica]|uniref:anti-sigma factor family protein n=1 Tax=Plastoroseomonas hellenica TaxID=2687306 RepID=UPI001BA9F0F8|nr:anti-sigma factor [Plastoroseomonas hellenica]MBR0644529.1 anti-sigma factor [Plastoroseomonas hellenica]